MKTPLILALLASSLTSAVAGGIYWTDRSGASGARSVRRAGLDGSSPAAIAGLTTRTDPRGIVVDRAGGKIHFADNTNLHSVAYNFSTQTAGTVTTLLTTTGTLRDLWHDRRDNWLYYANQAGGTVSRVALPGAVNDGASSFFPKVVPDAYYIGLYRYTSGGGTSELGMVCGNSDTTLSHIGAMTSSLLTANFLTGRPAGTNVRGVQVDPAGRFVYWCEKDTKQILRAPFPNPGANALGTPLQVLYSGLNAPHGLRLDLPRRRLYWVDSGTNTGGGFGQGGVNRGDLDGSSAAESLVVMNAGSGQPWDLDLDTRTDTFAEWQALNFRKDATAATKAATGDPDADGLDNTLEFALGTDPRLANPAPVTAGLWVDPAANPTGGGTYPTITFTRRTGVAGLTHTVQVTDDLATWQSNATKPGTTAEIGSPVSGEDGVETVTVRSLTPVSSGKRQSLRVKVGVP